MDPPAMRRANQQQQQQQQEATQQQSQGFPSPSHNYASLNPKFSDDCTRMTYGIQQSVPEAVRRIVRDNWEKCLLGSEFHQAFILNAAIHHSVPAITKRAIHDFGAKMVADSLVELVGHISTQHLDQVADIIIAKASDNFLDKCLEKRLLTIETQPLTQALAKAERLGFGPDDELQQEGHEAYQGAPAVAPPPSAYPSPAQQAFQCIRCLRTFAHLSAYDYASRNIRILGYTHMRWSICSQIPPTKNGFITACPHCGQGFTGADDLSKHLYNRACGNFEVPSTHSVPPVPPPVKVHRGPGRPPRNPPVAQPSPVSILPSQNSASNGHHMSSSAQLHSTPLPSRVAGRSVAGTPDANGSPIPSDPYGHLSEAKRHELEQELHEAELKYQPRFKEAEKIEDENERRIKIDGLRNSFGTKQSMIRKRYGVRLRERRTKAVIAAEKERLGLKRAEKEMALGSPTPQSASQRAASPVAGDPVSSRPVGNSGWTAANTPKPLAHASEEHDAKRRRVADEGAYVTPHKPAVDEFPTRKVSLGLDATTAESGQRPISLPPSRPSSQPASSLEPSSAPVPTASTAVPVSGSIVKPEPMEIDDDSSSSDDEDIPSRLPSHAPKRKRSPGGGMLGTPSKSASMTPPS
ncbi:hypothetical protein QBC42DRAFT_169541 [Cladorrhinum samala]|uniref:C2H2-type domain-containing protein n=1 Tax=Cladorrhinum samala TaxID=585594 RepID=A0AAV9HW84_9PEZI|nr:hypothetical protein QBC42DRAFT_169541 [Cladorrhinum samala]